MRLSQVELSLFSIVPIRLQLIFSLLRSKARICRWKKLWSRAPSRVGLLMARVGLVVKLLIIVRNNVSRPTGKFVV